MTAPASSSRIPEARRLRDAIVDAARARGVPLEEHALRMRLGVSMLRLRLGERVLRGCWVSLPAAPHTAGPDVVTVHGSGYRSSKMWPRRGDGTFDVSSISEHLVALVEQELSRPCPELLIPPDVTAAASGLVVVHLASVRLGVAHPDSTADRLVERVTDPKTRDRIETHLVRGGLTDRDMRALGDAAGLSLGTPMKLDFDPFEPISDRTFTIIQVGRAIGTKVERRYLLILENHGRTIDVADPAGEGLTTFTPLQLAKAWKLAARRGRSWIATASVPRRSR